MSAGGAQSTGLKAAHYHARRAPDHEQAPLLALFSFFDVLERETDHDTARGLAVEVLTRWRDLDLAHASECPDCVHKEEAWLEALYQEAFGVDRIYRPDESFTPEELASLVTEEIPSLSNTICRSAATRGASIRDHSRLSLLERFALARYYVPLVNKARYRAAGSLIAICHYCQHVFFHQRRQGLRFCSPECRQLHHKEKRLARRGRRC